MTRSTITGRSTKGWIVLILRALVLVLLVAALIAQGNYRLVPVAAVLGCLLVLFVLRDRARKTGGAVWSGSADLMKDGRKFAGQLSVERQRIIWTPTDYSRRHELSDIDVKIGAYSDVTFATGPALLDVVIDVPAPAGSYKFLTHRGPGLQRAIRQLSAGN